MEPEAVRSRVSEFAHRYPALSAKQTQFLSMLQNHTAKYGAIALDRLWERPFTLVDPAGADGVFTNEQQIPDLLDILGSFRTAGAPPSGGQDVSTATPQADLEQLHRAAARARKCGLGGIGYRGGRYR